MVCWFNRFAINFSLPLRGYDFLLLVIPLLRQCLEIHCDQSITIVLLKFQWLRHGQRSLQSTINSFINTLHVQKWFHHWIAITWKSSHATNWKNSLIQNYYKIIDFCCHQIFGFCRSAHTCAEQKNKNLMTIRICIFWNSYISITNINMFQFILRWGFIWLLIGF